MTVQTDESSAAAETCAVTGCCHAVLTADLKDQVQIQKLSMGSWEYRDRAPSPTESCTLLHTGG